MARGGGDAGGGLGAHLGFWTAVLVVPAALLGYAWYDRRSTCRALETPGETVEAFEAVGLDCGAGGVFTVPGVALLGGVGLGLGYGLGLIVYLDATGARVDDETPAGPYGWPLRRLAGAVDATARWLHPRVSVRRASWLVGAVVWAVVTWAVVEFGGRRVRAAEGDPAVELDPFVALLFDAVPPLGVAFGVVSGGAVALGVALLFWAVLEGASDGGTGTDGEGQDTGDGG